MLLAAIAALSACGDDKKEGDTDESAFEKQAALGQRLYGDNCAGCHGASGEGMGEAPRVVSLDEGALPLEPPPSAMLREAEFETVADVAEFVVENMPPGKAGSLSTEEYLAVLAFDLKANGITLEQELDLQLAESLTIPR
jgi:cytochrome c